MSGRRVLKIEIVGDDGKLRPVLGRVEEGLGKTAGGMDRAASAGRTLTMGVTLPLVGAMGLATKAAAEEGQEMAVLEQALRNNAGATDEQVAAVEDFITATQNATGVSDGQLRPALGNLLIAGRSVEEAQRDLAIALDIAAAKGLSVEAVTNAMGKAAQGNVGALGRLGIQTKDNTGTLLTYDQVLQNASKTMGGTAAEAADTSAGKMAIAQAKMADAAETAGEQLVPAMETGAKVVGTLAGAFGDLPGPAQNLLVIGALSSAAAGPVLSLYGNVGKLRGRVAEMGPAARTAFGAAGVAGAVGIGIASLVSMSEEMRRVRIDIDELGRATDEQLVDGFRALDDFGRGEDFFKGLIDSGDAGVAAGERLVKILQAEGEEVGHLREMLDREVEGRRASTEMAEEGRAIIEQDTGAREDNADATDDQKTALEEYNDELDESLGRLLSTSEASLRYRDALRDLTTAVQEGRQEGETYIEFKDRLEGQLIDVVKAAEDEIDAMVVSGQVANDAGAKHEAMRGRLLELAKQFPAMAPHIHGYIAEMDKVPPEKRTTLQLRTQEAMNDLREFEGAFDNLARKLATPLTLGVNIVARTVGEIPASVRAEIYGS